LPYLTGAPSDAVNRLLQESVSDLEQILDDAITKRVRAEAAEQVKQSRRRDAPRVTTRRFVRTRLHGGNQQPSSLNL
jgi:hypothetical protein